jgi:putative acetyltransferase
MKIIWLWCFKIFRKEHGEFKSIRIHDNFRNKGNGIK